MDIFKGICVICCENTLVVSGKDKQKFVELLKEHHFDTNQINDNKFLLQFKEKRSEKSICISCAHIIECYVSIRNKFKAIGKNNAKKCSICNSGYNITNGTTELIKDACTLLKNIEKARYAPRLTLICLECSFCIISWKKITDLIAKYPMGEKTRFKGIKRSHSVDSSAESEQSEASVENNETPVRNRKMKNYKKNTIMNNSKPKKKYLSKKQLKLENEVEEQLKHLSNVSSQISSKVVLLNNKVTKRVTSDDRMMFDIAYISCQTRNLESLIINKSKKSGSQREINDDDMPLTTRLRNKRNSASDTGSQQSRDLEPVKNKRIKRNKALPEPQTKKSVESDSDKQSPKMSKNKTKKLPRKSLRNKGEKQSDVIVVSDTDSNASPGRISKKKTVNSTPVRISLRLSKSTRLAKNQKEEDSKIQKISKSSKTNQCSSCDKKFVKKYKLQLHELEHEASFKPVVRVQKGNKKFNSDSEDKTASDNTETDDEIIDKQTTENNNVEKDSHSAETNENEKDSEKSESKKSADENEILDESVKQVVDDTLSQLEKESDENIKDTPDENQKSSSSQDLETAYSDISDGDKNIDTANKKQKDNADNEKELDIEDEKDSEDKKDSEENSTKKNNDNLEEQIETSNENSGTKEKINKDIENSETETDKTTKQSEKNDKINEKNNSQDTDHSSENNEDNVNDDDNETNEETNNSNTNKADLQECDKQREENSQDSAEDNSSNNSDKNLENNVIEIHEDKDDATNGLKSIVIEDDSSNSSNKGEEIEKVVSSDNSEKDKNINENKSIFIEDSPRSNKSEEDNVPQNSEDQINDVIESSLRETNDVESVEDITVNLNESEPNSQSTDKSIHIEDEMEPLYLSPESINSQNSEVNVSNKQKKSSDKYEIVENLLQNLGA